MFCTKCGKKLNGTEKSYPACGEKLRSREARSCSFKVSAGVGLATLVGLTVLYFCIWFVIFLICSPAEAKGVRIASIVCLVPILLLCVVMIIWRTDDIIVEGNQFYARKHLKKYMFSCTEIQTIHYYSHSAIKGGSHRGVYLILQDKKVFKADYKYKNFRRFAGYLSELHDTGTIAKEVISPEEKKKLLLIAEGKL